MLQGFPVDIKTLDSFPEISAPEEDGVTFKENAILKASYYQNITGLATLADDSGLEVDALGGSPGVFSARYAGEDATDLANNLKLLKEMHGLPWEQRKARFVCVIAIALPDGQVKLARGICQGYIREKVEGDEGFGYDPLFYYPPEKKTFAQMEADEKNRYSHRYKALIEAQKILKELLSL